MKSSTVAAGDAGLATQYNNLRADAYGGSILLPHEQSLPDLTLKIESGSLYIGSILIKYAGGNTPAFVAPTVNPRIDLVTIDNAGTVGISQGVEAGSPTAPNYPTYNKMVICEVYNRVGETSIKTSDDTINGYIYNDSRRFLFTGQAFNSRVSAKSTLGLQVTGTDLVPIDFDTENYDDAGDFDNANKTGTNTSTSANHLIDNVSNQFVAADVGRFVYNQVTLKYAKITALNSSSDVTIDTDIFPASPVGYNLFGSTFTAPGSGFYLVTINAWLTGAVADGSLFGVVVETTAGSGSTGTSGYAATTVMSGLTFSNVIKLSAGNTLIFKIQGAAGQTVVIDNGTFGTHVTVTLLQVI